MADIKIRRDLALAELTKLADTLEASPTVALDKATANADECGLSGAMRELFICEYRAVSVEADAKHAAHMIRFFVERMTPRRSGKG